MDIKKIFGARVKELRSSILMSQKELSERAGIDRTQISKIESGIGNVTLETIARISAALNIECYALLMTSDEDKTKVIFP